jgi:hypothetical protein
LAYAGQPPARLARAPEFGSPNGGALKNRLRNRSLANGEETARQDILVDFGIEELSHLIVKSSTRWPACRGAAFRSLPEVAHGAGKQFANF